MNEVKRVFISHHHDDAAALSLLKSKLMLVGLECFLAHEDIAPGEHDLNRIEKEIRECDMFLYIGSEAANTSIFCQQEIGMAKAFNKKIITTMTKNNPPKGFIERIYAISYVAIDTNFCDKVYTVLTDKLLFTDAHKKHLNMLGCIGFSRTGEPNTIHLSDDNWDDYGFRTAFDIRIRGRHIGGVKIGYMGQTSSEDMHDKLPNNFTHLSFPCFSRVWISSDQTLLTAEQINSLKYLLNDTELFSPKDLGEIVNEPVYKISLYR